MLVFQFPIPNLYEASSEASVPKTNKPSGQGYDEHVFLRNQYVTFDMSKPHTPHKTVIINCLTDSVLSVDIISPQLKAFFL